MEERSTALKDIVGSDHMFRGVVTGQNAVFYVSKVEADSLIAQDPQSAEIILPVLMGDDARRYETHFRENYLIFTRRGVPIERYPAVLAYISKHKERLLPKPIEWDDRVDGKWAGRKAGLYNWYEIQDTTAYFDLLKAPKIVFPQTGKEARFAMDLRPMVIDQTVYTIAVQDWFLLGLLNSKTAYTWMQAKCAVLGDEESGGRIRALTQYLESFPVPEASVIDRDHVGRLAQQAQSLHAKRRSRCEAFIRALGIDISASNSRNPLEQPWSLAADDYAKRARNQTKRAPDLKLYEAARDETAALTEQIAKVEAEIDARVAALYGLDAEDQRWAAQSAPADGKQTVFFDVLGKLKARRAHFSLTEVQTAVNDAELSLADDTLKVYLGEATRQGLIHDAGRGWYSRLAEPLKLDPQPVQKLIRATKKALPLLDFCAWSTAQLNPWMLHLLARHVAFLYVPRDTLDSVGETLREQGWNVAVNPGKHAVARDVRPGEKMVVLRPAHSKQPAPHDHHASPEQVLVDLLVETEALGLMDNSEARAVLVAATDSGTLKMADLKRFAEAKYLQWPDIWSIN